MDLCSLREPLNFSISRSISLRTSSVDQPFVFNKYVKKKLYAPNHLFILVASGQPSNGCRCHLLRQLQLAPQQTLTPFRTQAEIAAVSLPLLVLIRLAPAQTKQVSTFLFDFLPSIIFPVAHLVRGWVLECLFDTVLRRIYLPCQLEGVNPLVSPFGCREFDAIAHNAVPMIDINVGCCST